jgi:hypothetical protein
MIAIDDEAECHVHIHTYDACHKVRDDVLDQVIFVDVV